MRRMRGKQLMDGTVIHGRAYRVVRSRFAAAFEGPPGSPPDVTKGPGRALRMPSIEVSRETSPAWTLTTGFPFHAFPEERYSGSPRD